MLIIFIGIEIYYAGLKIGLYLIMMHDAWFIILVSYAYEGAMQSIHDELTMFYFFISLFS